MAQIQAEPATQSADKKDDRIYIRTTRAQKSALARAARARNQRTTEFVLEASLPAAEEVIAQEQRILLSERDFQRFVDAINNPRPPTPKLRDAMLEYRRLKEAHPDANL